MAGPGLPRILILGATPGDMFWSENIDLIQDLDVYFLDRTDPSEINPEYSGVLHEKFIKADVKSMRNVLQRFGPESFDLIAVDVGTWHHVTNSGLPDMKSIRSLLKTGGSLYIPESPATKPPAFKEYDKEKTMIKRTTNIGILERYLLPSIESCETVSAQNIILSLISSRSYQAEGYECVFILGTKVPGLGGGAYKKSRRKCKTNRRNSRKNGRKTKRA